MDFTKPFDQVSGNGCWSCLKVNMVCHECDSQKISVWLLFLVLNLHSFFPNPFFPNRFEISLSAAVCAHSQSVRIGYPVMCVCALVNRQHRRSINGMLIGEITQVAEIFPDASNRPGLVGTMQNYS